jgi:hypothetical protein
MKFDLSSLGAPDRIFVAWVMSGLTVPEVAERAGIAGGRAKHRLLNAAKLLRELGQDTSELDSRLT